MQIRWAAASGLESVHCPQGSSDWIRFTAGDASRIDLSSLRELVATGSGKAIFRTLGKGQIDANPAMLALGCRVAHLPAEGALVEVGGDFFFHSTNEVTGLSLGGSVVHFDGVPGVGKVAWAPGAGSG